MSFEQFNICPEVIRGIEKAGFSECTEIQEQVLPYTLRGKDIMAQSQTGTGKTATFLISIFHLLLTNDWLKERTALIIAPTRELVAQIMQEATILGSDTGLKFVSIIGGVGYQPQIDAINEKARIIIGTPGRLRDLIKKGAIDLSSVGIATIDEADRMFDMGFYPDIHEIMKQLPSRHERITMLFSATLSIHVRNMAWKQMNSPHEIELTSRNIVVDEVSHFLFHLSRNEKLSFLLGYLKKYTPASAIIFTNTKQAAERITQRLNALGFRAQFIIGDLPQQKRFNVIESLKSGNLQYLVATDVVARGLHIEDLALVINYDLPEYAENYVHRIGRTARTGKNGIAISLACERFVYNLASIEHYIGEKIPVKDIDPEILDIGSMLLASVHSSTHAANGHHNRANNIQYSNNSSSRRSNNSSSHRSNNSSSRRSNNSSSRRSNNSSPHRSNNSSPHRSNNSSSHRSYSSRKSEYQDQDQNQNQQNGASRNTFSSNSSQSSHKKPQSSNQKRYNKSYKNPNERNRSNNYKSPQKRGNSQGERADSSTSYNSESKQSSQTHRSPRPHTKSRTSAARSSSSTHRTHSPQPTSSSRNEAPSKPQNQEKNKRKIFSGIISRFKKNK